MVFPRQQISSQSGDYLISGAVSQDSNIGSGVRRVLLKPGVKAPLTQEHEVNTTVDTVVSFHSVLASRRFVLASS